MVRRLYSAAVDGRVFRPDQAFAYVQDEVESLHRADSPGLNAIMQTTIYVEGLRLGLRLSKESVYAQDMLALLYDAYGKCSRQDLVEAGMKGAELEALVADMTLVEVGFLK